jgi:hypothetical protein
MKASIAESLRSANAMEDVAKSLKINAEQIVETVAINRRIALRQAQFGELQLRAHVSVKAGIATYQDEANVFATGPIFINIGHTPAREFRFRVMADILPVPLPEKYRFSLPPRSKASSLLPPQDPRDKYTLVDHRIPDTEVEQVKHGLGKSLYVWGAATYKDAFGRTKRLTFLHQITWIGEPGKETVRAFYPSRHNRAN